MSIFRLKMRIKCFPINFFPQPKTKIDCLIAALESRFWVHIKLQVGQFHQHFLRAIFCTEVCSLLRVWVWTNFYTKKRARKILMKLTLGVNFINIFTSSFSVQKLFRTRSFCGYFLMKRIGVSDRKMLIKFASSVPKSLFCWWIETNIV